MIKDRFIENAYKVCESSKTVMICGKDSDIEKASYDIVMAMDTPHELIGIINALHDKGVLA